jgi:pimeloyl-ACP methyl ester carboxylesterase
VLARVLQLTVLFLISSAALAFIPIWSWSPWLAATVFCGALIGFSALLAVQCAAIGRLNGTEPAPRATSVQLVCAWWHETVVAARVFLWYQPFRPARYADQFQTGHGVRGIVLVHGFLCNRGVWAHWLPVLQQNRIPYCAPTLEPMFCSIDDYVPILDAAVRKMAAATGLPPLIVCHSMGGLVVRAWLRTNQVEQRAFRIVTIGTPHHGTVIGRHFPHLTRLTNAEQMRYLSPWLVALAQQEDAARRRIFVCFYSNCDNIVAPMSTATLPDSDNRFVDGVPHLALVFNDNVLQQTLSFLKADR